MFSIARNNREKHEYHLLLSFRSQHCFLFFLAIDDQTFGSLLNERIFKLFENFGCYRVFKIIKNKCDT